MKQRGEKREQQTKKKKKKKTRQDKENKIRQKKSRQDKEGDRTGLAALLRILYSWLLPSNTICTLDKK